MFSSPPISKTPVSTTFTPLPAKPEPTVLRTAPGSFSLNLLGFDVGTPALGWPVERSSKALFNRKQQSLFLNSIALRRQRRRHYHLPMPVETEIQAPIAVRAPRGTQITCKGWQQEAAM